MRKIFALRCLLLCFVLAGCTSAISLRNDMQQSKVAYKNCLEANDNPKLCEKERLIFNADVDAYSTVGTSKRPMISN